MAESFLRLDAVLARLPYSKTEWYRGIAEGLFPKPLPRRPDKPGSRGVCWAKSDIDQIANWIKSSGEIAPFFAMKESSNIL